MRRDLASTGFPVHRAHINRSLAPFYCSGHLIPCLEISGNKNNLKEQFEDIIAKNLITAQPQPKVTGSYKKACTP